MASEKTRTKIKIMELESKVSILKDEIKRTKEELVFQKAILKYGRETCMQFVYAGKYKPWKECKK